MKSAGRNPWVRSQPHQVNIDPNTTLIELSIANYCVVHFLMLKQGLLFSKPSLGRMVLMFSGITQCCQCSLNCKKDDYVKSIAATF